MVRGFTISSPVRRDDQDHRATRGASRRERPVEDAPAAEQRVLLRTSEAAPGASSDDDAPHADRGVGVFIERGRGTHMVSLP